MARRIKHSIRFDPDSYEKMRIGHEQSGSELSLAAYTRDVLTGFIPHPNFDPTNIDRGVFAGNLELGSGVRHHYQAVVLAMLMVRLKSDPEMRKYMNGDRETFELLVQQMRGYDFDTKTGLKSPLFKS